MSATGSASGLEANPFLRPSDLPFGLPPFERIRHEHFAPAFEAGMAEQIAEVDAIVGSAAPASFENTVVALERSGQLLRRVSVVFFTLASANTDDAIQELQSDVAPRLAAHADAIHLNPELYRRVAAVRTAGEALSDEQAHLLEMYEQDFLRAGASLSPEQQERLRAINAELSSLGTTFQQHLLADTNASAVVLDDVAQLAGLSDDAVAAAAETARSRGLDGKYVLTLALPTGQPALASLSDRSVRERLFRASVQRGRRGDANDNRGTVARIATLRAERAALLGYRDHASYVLADSTAGSPEAVTAMLSQVTPVAVANAEAEAAELRHVLGTEELHPWDWAYASEQVRRRTYDLDATALRPYFELERVLRDGIFHAAGLLYGLTFTERPDLPGYHPDVRVFEVTDADGSPLGLFLGDYYTREGKRGGAWMNSLVLQSALLGDRPVVVNNLNLTRPPAGKPTLLTFEEVTTAFHEFGHALHGLFSDVTYPSFSGTSVNRDFVEFPSQVNEMWALWPEVLASYARHHRTGEPIPQELVDRLLAARLWGEGFATTEYLGATLLDLAWHQIAAGTTIDDVDAFEADALAAAGVAMTTIPPRYRTTYFAHVFAGGYAAGYYSYLWSEVLDADTVTWFEENGGLRRENGEHFRRTLLAVGGSVAEMTAFERFRGRAPRIEPLLTRRGLVGPPT